MGIFSKKKSTIADMIVAYIKNRLPSGVIGFPSITHRKTNDIVIVAKPPALSFEFEYDTNQEVNELTEVDKQHLDNVIVLPALKQLDKDLWGLHKQIEKKIKDIENE